MLVVGFAVGAQAFYRRNGWRLLGPAGGDDVGAAQVPILRYRLDLAVG